VKKKALLIVKGAFMITYNMKGAPEQMGAKEIDKSPRKQWS
jgi:hypothetical protein